jgi:hypothetical protein
MVWEVSFTCDVCGATKGEANHWWMLSLAECPCDDIDQVPQRFSVIPWSVEQSRDGEMRHLCGKGMRHAGAGAVYDAEDRRRSGTGDSGGSRR